MRRIRWTAPLVLLPRPGDPRRREYAVVAAIVGGGRVRVLQGWIGAAGE
jgi:hypothetical protein